MDAQDQERQRPGATDLFGSAKVVADAAQSTFNKDYDKVDKGRVAGAASNILEAASQYGNLDDKGVGKYVDQAQGYLDKYQSSQAPPAKTTGAAHATTEGDAPSAAAAAAAAEPERRSEEEGSGGGGGIGGNMKMAQGFLGK